jgi:hypothetical protein
MSNKNYFLGNVKLKVKLVRIHSFSLSANSCLFVLSCSCIFSTTLTLLYYFIWNLNSNLKIKHKRTWLFFPPMYIIPIARLAWKGGDICGRESYENNQCKNHCEILPVCIFESVTRDRPLYRPPSLQAIIDFLKWYLSVNFSEIYGKFQGCYSFIT